MEPFALSLTEHATLQAYEQTITEGLQTFVAVGQALLAIREQRLYRAEYATFEGYCRERWGIARSRAYQLIDAAEVAENVHNCGQILPANEAQARPLTGLTPEEQRAVWQAAVATAEGGTVTAAHVQATVTQHFRTQFTGEQEWYTPLVYIEAAKLVMGGIDLDPASSVNAQETVQAAHFFTAEANGLAQEWHGRVWLNPPYTQPFIEQFMSKLVTEYALGHVREAIALTHNYTDTAWFHTTEAIAARICFTKGRIRFLDPTGKPAAPTQGQAFFYLGTHPELFERTFGSFGFIR